METVVINEVVDRQKESNFFKSNITPILGVIIILSFITGFTRPGYIFLSEFALILLIALPFLRHFGVIKESKSTSRTIKILAVIFILGAIIIYGTLYYMLSQFSFSR